MEENLKAFGSMVNIRQILIGLSVLLIGSLVYLIDRPPDQTYFVYSCPFNISLFKTFPNLFGLIGNSLPAFVHVFSFILITAGLLSYQKKGCIIICACWFIIDCAFELGKIQFIAFKNNSRMVHRYSFFRERQELFSIWNF